MKRGGHGSVARKVITFRRERGRQNPGISSVEISERRKKNCAYPTGREEEGGRARGNERTNERTELRTRTHARTHMYVRSLARIILVDGASAGSINSSVPLYPVEGEITLEIITG